MIIMSKNYPFELLDLPYEYDYLEPVLGSETLHFHHDKHMQAYVNNLNAALEAHKDFHDLPLNILLSKIKDLPESAQNGVRNNGGGVYNHELYFSTITKPNNGTKPSASLQEAIDRDLGGYDALVSKLKAAATTRFGSGWAYVIADEEGNLSIVSTPNQDVPDLTKYVPLMTVDVWEHAYYLDYQNRRPDYYDAYMTLINWDEVNKRYEDRKSYLA